MAFHLARCLVETPWSSVLPEHLASESSNSGLTKVMAVMMMIEMMSATAVAAERLPDVLSVLEQVSPGCRAMWCTVQCLKSGSCK